MFNKYTNADIIDRAVVSSNCWLMYGCCKPNKEPYTVSKYYNSNNESLNISDVFKLSVDNDKFSPNLGILKISL